MFKAAKAYLSTQVSTASKGDLLLMLYDTAIKHLKLAVERMAEKDYAAKGILISKAISIISELQESLNKEHGGDVTKNLFQLYFICNTKLLSANIQMNPALVEEVIGILSGLRQAFAQIIPMHQGGSAATASAPFAPGAKPAQEPAQVESATAAPAPAPEQQPVAAPQSQEQPSPEQAEPSSPAQPGSAQPDPVQASPVQTVRLRAANAYANAR